VTAWKNGENPIGAGQFQNDSHLAVEAAQVQLLSALSDPLESGDKGTKTAAVHELNITAINYNVSGTLLYQ
jgi:hypothetical protein